MPCCSELPLSAAEGKRGGSKFWSAHKFESYVLGFVLPQKRYTRSMGDRHDQVDEFTHELAINISRALNLSNPNDLLAKQVIQLAKSHKHFDKFAAGTYSMSLFFADPLY